jgi:hypothetical protein
VLTATVYRQQLEVFSFSPICLKEGVAAKGIAATDEVAMGAAAR